MSPSYFFNYAWVIVCTRKIFYKVCVCQNYLRPVSNTMHATKTVKQPYPLPSETRQLQKEVKAARKQLAKQTNTMTSCHEEDDLDDLSEDSSNSSGSLSNFVARDCEEERNGPYANLDATTDDEDDYYNDDEDNSMDASISGDVSSEENRQTKKRKLDTVVATPPVTEGLKPLALKCPRLSMPQARLQTAKLEKNGLDEERLNRINNTLVMNIKEYETVQSKATAAIRLAEERLAELEEKENHQVQDSLFVVNRTKVVEDLERQDVQLKQKQEALEKQQDDLLLKMDDYAKQQQHLQIQTEELAKLKKELQEKMLDLEKREKAMSTKPTHTTQPTHPALSASGSKNVPLEAFINEMHRLNQNMATREELQANLHGNVLCALAYHAGKQPVKYHSFSNSQYLVIEVAHGETGQLMLQQIVSKQLYSSGK